MSTRSSNLAGSRSLVTGGAGLVGSHITRQLVKAGAAEVIVYDNLVRGTAEQLGRLLPEGGYRLIEGDLRDMRLLQDAMEGVDFLFHQAAIWLRECQANPRKSIDVNIIGTYNVLETAVEANVKKVVAASSSSVYGDGLYLPTDEDHPLANDLFYGATKVAGEQLLRCFENEHGLDYIALRPLNIYGPHQAAGSAYMDVIGHFAQRIERGEPPQMEGDGSQTLDMVYVSDCARANLLAMESAVSGEVFNVASGRETTVAELAQILLRLYGREDLEPVRVPRDQKLVSRRWGSADKAREVLGFEVEVPVEEGLRRVIEARHETPTRAS
jgi:nucleoside-diphosphate-sugar epimerase